MEFRVSGIFRLERAVRRLWSWLRLPVLTALLLVLAVAVVASALALLNAYMAPQTAQDRKDFLITASQMAAGLVVLFGLIITWRTLRLNQQGQVTDRFTRAIDQLGSTDTQGNPRLEIRLGGIYALGRIATDSARDYTTIMEILAAYVRHNAPRPSGEIPSAEAVLPGDFAPVRPRSDIQAALSILVRLYPSRLRKDRVPLDLRSTDLRGADLRDADLPGALLTTCILHHVNLSSADLAKADLTRADLSYADLSGANLTEARLPDSVLRHADCFRARFSIASLDGADLSGAHMLHSDLSYAMLSRANLEQSDLSDSDLRRSGLMHANLPGARLLGVDLRGAKLWDANLCGADLFGAKLAGADFRGANLDGADLGEVTGLSLKQSVATAEGDHLNERPDTAPAVEATGVTSPTRPAKESQG